MNNEKQMTPAQLQVLMNAKFRSYCEIYGREPLYAECTVKYKDDGNSFDTTVKMSSCADENDPEDDEIFFYCDTFSGLKGLTQPDGGEDFYIIAFHGFAGADDEPSFDSRHDGIHLNADLLKERVSVVRFSCFNYDRKAMLDKSDADVLGIAENDSLNCIVHDTLAEFQADFNDGELDWNNCYMKFCVQPFRAMTDEDLARTSRKIREAYQGGGVCMAELLAALPADCMSIEQAARLYVEAMNWADGDLFYVKRSGEELAEFRP